MACHGMPWPRGHYSDHSSFECRALCRGAPVAMKTPARRPAPSEPAARHAPSDLHHEVRHFARLMRLIGGWPVQRVSRAKGVHPIAMLSCRRGQGSPTARCEVVVAFCRQGPVRGAVRGALRGDSVVRAAHAGVLRAGPGPSRARGGVPALLLHPAAVGKRDVHRVRHPGVAHHVRDHAPVRPRAALAHGQGACRLLQRLDTLPGSSQYS